MQNRIYLDSNATTALDPRVFQAMLEDLSGPPANPSSIHFFGQRAKKLLGQARSAAAGFFRSKPEEVVFTSGGTEGVNTLLRGIGPGHFITTAIEHSCVYNTIESMKAQGASATYIPVGLQGCPSPADIAASIRSETKAMIFAASNSETGVKIDLEAIADLAAKHSIPLFIDAVSFAGKEPLHLPPGVSGAVISAHKFHGPKGIGAIFSKRGIKLHSILTGGSQEHLLRPGTENLSGALGLASALSILQNEQEEIAKYLLDLRSHFECELLRHLPDVAVNGLGERICNVSNIAFLGCDGETLLLHLDMAGIAASHGSACSSGALEPSRVLLNMGIDRKVARSSIRFSFSRQNTREEIDQALAKIIELVNQLRAVKNR